MTESHKNCQICGNCQSCQKEFDKGMSTGVVMSCLIVVLFVAGMAVGYVWKASPGTTVSSEKILEKK